ncbi:MAG: hypothetical protein K9M49_06965 [Candidatus Marinimicrobia bacterium]|nr:hypothetical protein [Candidatus Neomarinimicrobiota bacterium]MCF7850056.1 hypothetical protein [Candidatus Neomarinimicrobiota bacterium]MCF7904880.1 hypothetical protein [Candidatus Neomarinimicrobiota bacterium]
MTVKIGIMAEHKSGEGRIPLTPAQIEKLQQKYPDLTITVSPSDQRKFDNTEFTSRGIKMSEDLQDENLVIAVKEIKTKDIRGGQAYLYFSHTIKGQDYNMPMLQHILDVGATLLDYELIADENDRRLVFFGVHAGLAGMVNSLWAYGQRMQVLGQETPFLKIKQAKEYKDLSHIKAELSALGPELTSWLADKPALVVGLTGYGNVSKGAQEILDLLPLVEISPQELLHAELGAYKGKLVKVVFEESDMFQRHDGEGFDLKDYFINAGEYESKFYLYLERLDILVNCIYWTADCPRLITLDEIRAHYSLVPRLQVVGDITCDIDGSIQFNVGSTPSSDPVYVYQIEDGEAISGFQGKGPLVMAVDNLPAELPREASEAFGDALAPFVYAMGACDYSKKYEDLDLPMEVKKAVIAHHGKLAPKFEYLSIFVEV